MVEIHLPLIKNLIGLVGHIDLISNAKEQQASFSRVESGLANDLIKALVEELFTHRTKTRFTSLSFEKFLIEHLSKTSHVDSCGWLVAHILHEVLALLNPLSWR